MAEFRISFTMDEAYLREFFEEWVSLFGQGWRRDRVMISIFGFAGVIIGLIALWYKQWPLLGLGATAGLIAAFEAWKSARRRSAWLQFCRSQPWFCREMNIAVRNGILIQENDYDGDPRFDRTAPIRLTPHGYLVRYAANTPIDTPPAVSGISASVYIPHRTILPAVDRNAFAALIGAV